MTTTLTKVVIPVAGLGTRLLSATKEQPKEMLPIFSWTDGELSVKPVVQVIYEHLFDYGFREFYFIVGRNKRAIEDHFTVDYDFIDYLEKKGKSSYAKGLANFYSKLSMSSIVWTNQNAPLGFGHAVLMAKNLIKDETFLVHAGDTIVSSNKNSHIKKLIRAHYSSDASCTLLVRRVKDPKQYGVIMGTKDKNSIIRISRLEEKPSHPFSNLAIMPVYVFQSSIFDALEKTLPGKANELQLTDAIMNIVKSKNKVIAVEMCRKDMWIDVGSPESYWEALSNSYKKSI